MKIAHIINPVKVGDKSDLFLAQPVTFESMIRAKEYSKIFGGPSIDLFSISFSEDRGMVPNGFQELPDLTESVLDLKSFNNPKKLPMIKDILMPFTNLNEYDYIVYSNVDIAIMPFFYNVVADYLKGDCDSLIINRRVIKEFDNTGMDYLYQIAGTKHPGYDCFVFPQKSLSDFCFANACIGANFIGRVMFLNLFSFTKKMEILKESHLTFHLGEDGDWLTGRFSDYDEFNRNEVMKVLEMLSVKMKSDTFKLEEYQKMREFVQNWNLDNQYLHKRRIKNENKKEGFFKKMIRKFKSGK